MLQMLQLNEIFLLIQFFTFNYLWHFLENFSAVQWLKYWCAILAAKVWILAVLFRVSYYYCYYSYCQPSTSSDLNSSRIDFVYLCLSLLPALVNRFNKCLKRALFIIQTNQINACHAYNVYLNLTKINN